MPSAFRAADTGAETEAVEIAGLSPSSLEATKEPRAPRVNNAPPAAPTAPLLDNDKLQQMVRRDVVGPLLRQPRTDLLHSELAISL